MATLKNSKTTKTAAAKSPAKAGKMPKAKTAKKAC